MDFSYAWGVCDNFQIKATVIPVHHLLSRSHTSNDIQARCKEIKSPTARFQILCPLYTVQCTVSSPPPQPLLR